MNLTGSSEGSTTATIENFVNESGQIVTFDLEGITVSFTGTGSADQSGNATALNTALTTVSASLTAAGISFTQVGSTIELTKNDQSTIDITNYSATPAFDEHLISGASTNEIEVGDIDNDGDIDVLAGTGLYINDGSENFSASSVSDAGVNENDLVDLDGDGDLDIVSLGTATNDFSWLENDGSGSFTTHTVNTGSSQTNVWHTHPIDLDQDGDMDVLSTQDGRVVWFENDGSENFTENILFDFDAITSNYQTRQIKAADFDNDGDIDIVYSAGDIYSTNDVGIEFLRNNGSNSFTRYNVTSADEFAPYIKVIDLDGDNDLDFIASRGAANSLSIYTYNGGGSFTRTQITVSSSQGVDAADIDADGDIDFVNNSHISGTSWYENDGSQNFTSTVVSTTDGVPDDIVITDLDGDGDQDIVHVGNDVYWQEHLSAGFTLTSTGSSSGSTTLDSTSNRSGSVQPPPNNYSLSTQDRAMSSMTTIDNALKTISSERAKLGAFHNRMEHRVSNLETLRANTAASRSRIEDTDYAVESASLAKTSILKQASTAMIAHANQQQKLVLQLLKQST